MKRKVLLFFAFFILFDIGMFFGQWIMDLIFENQVETIAERLRDSTFISLFISAFFVFSNKFFDRLKK